MRASWLGPQATSTQHGVSDGYDPPSTTIHLDEAAYAEESRKHSARTGTVFFVTVTYPGGIREEARSLLVGMCNEERVVQVQRPIYHILVGEGDGITEHEHIHGILWFRSQRRSDSVTRTIRHHIFNHEDLSRVSDTRRLVLCRTALDIAGVFRYILKRDPPAIISKRLPPSYDYETVLKEVRSYVPPQASQHSATGFDDDPEDGKTRSVPPTRVPDFLLSYAQRTGVDLMGVNGFGTVVRNAFQRGWRFDLRQLRSYRMAVELVLAPDATQIIDEVQAKSMYGA